MISARDKTIEKINYLYHCKQRKVKTQVCIKNVFNWIGRCRFFELFGISRNKINKVNLRSKAQRGGLRI